MTREETIGALQSIIEEDKNAILARVHVGFLIHAVKYLKEDQGIVRCKNCIHHHKDNDDCQYCDRIDYGYGWKDDDYCSKAEAVK